MRFRKIQRKKAARPKVLHVAPVKCPWCGALDSLRARSTQKRGGKTYRYSICLKCRNPVTRISNV